MVAAKKDHKGPCRDPGAFAHIPRRRGDLDVSRVGYWYENLDPSSSSNVVKIALRKLPFSVVAENSCAKCLSQDRCCLRVADASSNATCIRCTRASGKCELPATEDETPISVSKTRGRRKPTNNDPALASTNNDPAVAADPTVAVNPLDQEIKTELPEGGGVSPINDASSRRESIDGNPAPAPVKRPRKKRAAANNDQAVMVELTTAINALHQAIRSELSADADVASYPATRNEPADNGPPSAPAPIERSGMTTGVANDDLTSLTAAISTLSQGLTQALGQLTAQIGQMSAAMSAMQHQNGVHGDYPGFNQSAYPTPSFDFMAPHLPQIGPSFDQTAPDTAPSHALKSISKRNANEMDNPISRKKARNNHRLSNGKTSELETDELSLDSGFCSRE